MSQTIFLADKQNCYREALHQAGEITQRANLSFGQYSNMVDSIQADCMVSDGHIVTSRAQANVGTASAPTLVDQVMAAKPQLAQPTPVFRRGMKFQDLQYLQMDTTSWSAKNAAEYKKAQAALNRTDYDEAYRIVSETNNVNCSVTKPDSPITVDLSPPLIRKSECSDSYYLQGYLEESGLGTPKSPALALTSFASSARLGSNKAKFELALLYESQPSLISTARDNVATVPYSDVGKLLSEAAAGGVEGAQAELEKYRTAETARLAAQERRNEIYAQKAAERDHVERAAYAALPESVKVAHAQCQDSCQSTYRACRMSVFTPTGPATCSFPVGQCRGECDEKYLPYKRQ